MVGNVSREDKEIEKYEAMRPKVNIVEPLKVIDEYLDSQIQELE